MKETYRWEDERGVHEYRFTDGVCDGFFTNGEQINKDRKYNGSKLTQGFKDNLKIAGFIKVD